MPLMTLFLLFLFISSFSGNLQASSAGAGEENLRLLEIDLVSLLNPAGISFTARGYARHIYRHDKSPLWDGLYYQTGAQIRITPAFSRAGIQIEWLPIKVVKLRAEYDRLYFSGNYGSLLSFTSNTAFFDDDDLEAREGEEISAYGTRTAIQLTMRAKFDEIIIRNVIDFIRYEFPGNGPYYLERENELLMATTDDVVSNQLFILFEHKTKKGSRFYGPYHDYVHVDQSNLTRERLGVTWLQQYKKMLFGLQDPRWYIQSGIYLQDPNREGDGYLLLGVGGDIQF